jgi:hypothetical protein
MQDSTNRRLFIRMTRIHPILNGKLRSALITAAAVAVVGGSSALANNLPKLGAHPSPSNSSAPKPSPSSDVKGGSGGTSAGKSVSSGDNHGACVRKVAEDHAATAENKHGKKTHGAAVSKAAHTCPKGGEEGAQTGKSSDTDTDKPEPKESPEVDKPEPKESPEVDKPEPKESPEVDKPEPKESPEVDKPDAED